MLKAKSEKVKYVDDGTVAVSVDLKASLIPDPNDRARSVNFHERTGNVLPVENNLLQYYVTDTEQFVAENKMVINKKKTKIKFPLTPMGVLAPGSAHARPSAQPPIDMSGNFPAHVSAESPSKFSEKKQKKKLKKRRNKNVYNT